MRFIIHELAYERPISAGRLRYERDGVPTGAVEMWRLSHAQDGYRFLRVDMDAREAPSGHSCLYHVTLNSVGRPEQLKFRFWGGGQTASGSAKTASGSAQTASGTAVWDGDVIISARRVNDAVDYEDVARGTAFWFPSGAGLAILAQCDGEKKGATLLVNPAEPAGLMAIVETPVAIALGAAEIEQVGADLLPVRPLVVTWGENSRTVWLDVEGRPLRLLRDDGLSATAERLIRYD